MGADLEVKAGYIMWVELVVVKEKTSGQISAWDCKKAYAGSFEGWKWRGAIKFHERECVQE